MRWAVADSKNAQHWHRCSRVDYCLIGTDICPVCRWDEQNALLVESHERVIKDITEEAEAKLAVEVLAAQTLRQEKDVLLKEASEVSNCAAFKHCELIDVVKAPITLLSNTLLAQAHGIVCAVLRCAVFRPSASWRRMLTGR